MTSTNIYQDREALEARLAFRLAAGLSEQASALPNDLSERLRVAREQAVARARASRSVVAVPAAASAVVGHSRGSAVLGGAPSPWQRLASVLPLVVLVAGLLLIHQWVAHEQVLAAVEIDSVLLADDLPPAAYTDPGFAEYLKSPPP
ncbi:MAG: DUF3619 family protein [Burkholderiales bacterium]|nr:DUF3619 family protein [Burkholderiales bacterium]MDE2397188.1 DUF3619 family protein [Burkholderiales bacterium]MDE2455764.1 DUF3619 family protein [Burkholderiales bacterium]